jgi:hypothetical protein
MAKKPDITTIASGYYSRQALNNNFENLQDGFDNTLSLDGSTPNAMGADFDVNGNNILNAGQIATDTLLIGGVAVAPGGDVNFETTYLTASYVGDGSTVAYSLTANPQTENNVNIYVDGVYQNKDTFGLSGTTVTFSEAPPLNAAIEIVYPTNTDTLNGSAASAITYNQGGTGAQDRTVEAKLQETVSVKDFGAVGDGVTDDTAAINLALASGARSVYAPAGTYKITDTLFAPSGSKLFGAGKGLTVLDGSSAGPSQFFGHDTHIALGSTTTNYTSLPALGSNCVEGDILVTFASAHGLSKGDVFYVSDPTTSSLTGYRTYYKKGQIYQVDSVDSTTVVRVTTPHKFDLLSANCVCAKNTATRGGSIQDLTLLCYPSEANLTVGIKAASEVGLSIKNVEVRDPHFMGISLTEGVFDFEVDGCTVLGTPDSAPNDETYQYGIVAGIAAVGRITNNYAVAGRHAIDGGDGSASFQVCTTDVIIDGNNTHSIWNQSISAHGSCLDWIISNNIATGVTVRGGGHVITGNRIIARGDSESEHTLTRAFQVAELYNPTNIISNNDVLVYDTDSLRGAFIDCGGNSGNLDVNTNKSGKFIVENNRFILKSGADVSSVNGITFRNRGATGIIIHMMVKNNTFQSEIGSVLAAVFLDVVSGDNIFRLDMQSNYVDQFDVCDINDCLNITVKDNFSISASSRAIDISALNTVVSGNTIRGSADTGIHVLGEQRCVVMGNEVDTYHVSAASGSSVDKGAITAWTANGGSVFVHNNIASDAGASAPSWAYQVWVTSGTPAYVSVANNVDTDLTGLRNSAGLTVKGPENFSTQLIDGATRHELTAPSGVLNIDGSPV